MATKDQIAVGDSLIMVVDSNPKKSGLEAPLGSIAIYVSEEEKVGLFSKQKEVGLYFKVGKANRDWCNVLIPTA